MNSFLYRQVEDDLTPILEMAIPPEHTPMDRISSQSLPADTLYLEMAPGFTNTDLAY
jgi:hypothetical protein